jgi:hypothetical protein
MTEFIHVNNDKVNIRVKKFDCEIKSTLHSVDTVLLANWLHEQYFWFSVRNSGMPHTKGSCVSDL